MRILGDNRKRRQHRSMTSLMGLIFTILPTLPSCNPREKTSTASIDQCYGVRGSSCLRSARATLPKSKRCTQGGDMINVKYQHWTKVAWVAETRGSGKVCSRSSRCQPMVPDDAIDYGKTWENQEIQKKRCWTRFMNLGKLILHVKMAKNTENGHLCEILAILV